VGTTGLSGGFRGDRPLGGISRSVIQQGIGQEYREFIGLVAKARGKTVEQVDAIAQGRVWAGADAQDLGLVDELGRLLGAWRKGVDRQITALPDLPPRRSRKQGLFLRHLRKHRTA